MNFQVGDLIITKDNKNRRIPAYIIEVHEPGEDKDGVHYWNCKSITFKYSQDEWTRMPIKTIERHLNQPNKLARWYHFPVK
jgi:hypothetical protein